jgi:hypothetical protein
VFISPVRSESAEIVQYFASFADVTKHKEDQANAKLLIDELNHRVKNTLSTVQSIVWQAMRTASDPKVIREVIESRLFALFLKKAPADLTMLSASNNGVFPAERTYEAIDGRREVGEHGTREMPVWGRTIRIFPKMGRAKFQRIVDYLATLQGK